VKEIPTQQHLLDVGFIMQAGFGGEFVKTMPVGIRHAGDQGLGCLSRGERPFGCANHPAAAFRFRGSLHATILQALHEVFLYFVAVVIPPLGLLFFVLKM
jgi:hypothetical protein